ncbi:MAG: hypothetical protein B7X86_04940 [Sphingobacteriales bacterium 17-39-43]|uniref:hypothetical protein n=1 Tax=Daejeonella sp. TaxID=2805397 RepID=UPI000BCA5B48|nr:hypothetical protein [Daejeonella sp.]OYZ32188.1 MAG: hypothetical protein B7Y24_05760 [Sphingobacteriales bacterium 16-39-50]OZA25532.1 MAG: hypothetical protein B7X86_04940 [Sphingobacteriales bacterium 17-39-43]HQS50708.1 hypothetical protein [Daejeonella sp.]HQT22198.1 hypothetical protein [Daejeonella sp.]HQT57505.1 hypothetical protein [Daejeonella sp.]
MEEKDIHSELASIRSLMERSSKFLSLSGLSGVMAGIYALIGAFIGYKIVNEKYGSLVISDSYTDNSLVYHQLILIAGLILLLSILSGLLLSIRQAKKKGENYWNPVSRRLISSMAIPLFSGGLFIIILFLRLEYDLIPSACLIFYGLSLISASQYTFSDVKWLGFCQIILGLLAALIPASGLLFWVIGFGLLHIIYGTVMHFKYNR